jgi:hypothetical protein
MPDRPRHLGAPAGILLVLFLAAPAAAGEAAKAAAAGAGDAAP